MDSKTLNEIQGNLEKRAGGIAMNEAYVAGKNPYILSKPTEKIPDNRIPAPLAKISVESMAGYAGRYGDIVTDYELVAADTEDKDDPFLEYMRDMDAYNKEPLETSELYDEMLVQGRTYEIWWTSDELKLTGLLTAEFKIVPTASVHLRYTNTIKKELEEAVYFSGDKEEMQAEVYTVGMRETWEKKCSGEWALIDEQEQPFTQVQVNVFTGNRRETPLFQAEKPLIDQYDKLISKASNEVDRFNAAIALFGNSVTPQFRDDLAKGMIAVIDELGMEENENYPKYLVKDLGGIDSFVNTLTDRVEALFHKSIKVPDMADPTFAGGNIAGIAIAFKLIGMEFKASQIETYFNQGLVRRLSFYADIYNASSKSVDIADYKATVKASRNIPMDVKAKAEVAQILMGIVSEETLLKFLPKQIVDDVKKEIERKKTEQPADILGITEV